MCGIVGIITKATNGFTWPQQDLFDEMLVCDSVRGPDSTGMFAVSRNGNAEYIKLASHPFNLVKNSEYKALRSNTWNTGKIMIGHNRKATIGSITNENAHPFAFGPVLLVHNGYIENFRSLVHHKERDQLKIEVDSACVALMMSREDPVKVLGELKGAFALIWYNAADKKLRLVRNSERPLSMSEGSDGSYFSSERGLLRWMLARRGLKADVAELKPGVLVTIDLDGKSELQEVKLYEKPPVSVSAPTRYHNTHDQHRRPPPPVAIDENGVIHLPDQRDRVRIPKKIDMTPVDSFNVHYGMDQEVELDPEVKWPQIVFSCEDYSLISEENVDPPVWRVWGPALDSTCLQVVSNFRGTEKEVEELAYADHLCAHITRLGDRTVGGRNEQVVYATLPRKVNIVTTPNELPIIDEHLAYINNGQCACYEEGKTEAIQVSGLKDEDVLYARQGFKTSIICRWCIEGTPSCEQLCKEPGKCEYCVNCAGSRELDKAGECGG